MIIVSLNTGIRQDALFALKWDDNNFNDKTITLRATSAKSRKTTIIPINQAVIDGAESVLNNKKIQSNCSFAGNPAKLVKEGVYFSRKCVHTYSEKDSMEHENGSFTAGDSIFQYDEKVYLPFDEIDSTIDGITNPQERLDYLVSTIYNNRYKNRFAR